MHIRTLTLSLLILAAPAALAHGQGVHSHEAGLIAGFLHPFSGLDHLLAMLAVGLWAAQQGGRALWALPASFVAAMAIGGAVGVMGIALPGIESGIALSVLVLGLLVAMQSRWALGLACAMTGFFALFHGMAHGQEMPIMASSWTYAAAMLTATGLLHASGVFAGVRFRSSGMRLVGAAMSLAGIGMLLPLAA